ncbi:MAG: beta-phosphoglucomutase [Trueperaceae bacterium]|nr:beta-phosphoglucomutase [Trueperaceae bacterium]
MRSVPDPPSPRYDVAAWSVAQGAPTPEDAARDAAIFTVANGYVGIRGGLEEADPDAPDPARAATFLNGVFERWTPHYPEDAYGLARHGQTMLVVPAAHRVALHVDGVPLDARDPRASDVGRTLDLRAGTLRRRYRWTTDDGARLDVRTTRVVSLVHRHRFALRVEIAALDRGHDVTLAVALDGRVHNAAGGDDPRVGNALRGQVLQPVRHAATPTADGPRLALQMRAPASGMELAVALAPTLHAGGAPDATWTHHAEPLRVAATAAARLTPDAPLTLDAPGVYVDARDVDPDGDPSDALAARTDAALSAATANGVDALLDAQRRELDAFWADADVEIEGDPAATQALRYGLFQMRQGAARDGRANLPAKALSGEGYEGHTFWDTEAYALPVLQHVDPAAARALLENRIAMLDAARARAQALHHRGALFAWRTIAGEEASAYFPAGSAQRHLGADVVHALAQYLEATGDDDLPWAGGADLATEVARAYLSLGHWGRDGRFHLFTVTGPDEYAALVDDNHYTNRMAQHALRVAADLVDRLADADPPRFDALATRLALTDDEPAAWRAAADAMHLPVDATTGVTPQDAHFLDRPEWPWDDVPADRYPLLLHYHPLDIYRHQVLKQADVLLAHLQLGGVRRTQRRRDEAYYLPRTSHDSSLSPFAHAIHAAWLGRPDDAAALYRATARTDLDDLHGNTADGLHLAAMAGTWRATLEGFGGLTRHGGRLAFHPRLPRGWEAIRARLRWRGTRLEVRLGRTTTTYRHLDGPDLTLHHRGEPIALPAGAVVERSSRPRLRGVAFDLDGVLTDSAEHHYQAWKALADALGIPFDRAANEALRGVPRMASLDAILARGDRTLDDAEKAALAERKNADYVRRLEAVGPDDLLPGIADLLDALAGAGVRLAVASSSRNAPTLLERLGIADRFDAVVDPATVRFGKPDPEIFEAAADALALDVEDVVGVEDAQAGVAAIRGAGMPAVGVGDATALAAADVVVPDTRHLHLDVLEAAVARRAASGDA